MRLSCARVGIKCVTGWHKMIVSGNNERFSENFFKLEIGLVCGFSLYGGKARLQGDFFSDGRISLIYSFLTEGDVTGDVLRRRQHLIAIHSLLTKGDGVLQYPGLAQ